MDFLRGLIAFIKISRYAVNKSEILFKPWPQEILQILSSLYKSFQVLSNLYEQSESNRSVWAIRSVQYDQSDQPNKSDQFNKSDQPYKSESNQPNKSDQPNKPHQFVRIIQINENLGKSPQEQQLTT